MRAAREYTLFGMVQGVGMRWTCKRIADAYGLDGWVRNNPEGSVTLSIEGEEPKLDAFIAELNNRMGANITEYRLQPTDSGKNRHGFDVVF